MPYILFSYTLYIGWEDLRLKRLIAREKKDKTSLNLDELQANRPQRLLHEDDLMCKEVLKYGHVLLPYTSPNPTDSLDHLFNPALVLKLDMDNFDPNDPKIRPPGIYLLYYIYI